jgi:hypothetical protein
MESIFEKKRFREGAGITRDEASTAADFDASHEARTDFHPAFHLKSNKTMIVTGGQCRHKPLNSNYLRKKKTRLRAPSKVTLAKGEAISQGFCL